MTVAKSAFGTLLKAGDGASPEVFTTILEVRNFTGVDISLTAIDVTNQSSTTAMKEFIGGLLDGGAVAGEMNWKGDNATQSATAGLVYKQAQRTVNNYQIVIPMASTLTFTFPALVTKIGPSNFDMDGALVLPFELKVAGAWTWS